MTDAELDRILKYFEWLTNQPAKIRRDDAVREFNSQILDPLAKSAQKKESSE